MLDIDELIETLRKYPGARPSPQEAQELVKEIDRLKAEVIRLKNELFNAETKNTPAAAGWAG